MNLIRLSFASFLLIAAAAVFTIAFGNVRAAKSDMQLCKHQYALCTSALCIPQPGDPTKAICFCAVEEGASMASVPCNTIQPSTDANGIRTIYSAFGSNNLKHSASISLPLNGAQRPTDETDSLRDPTCSDARLGSAIRLIRD